jgi:hypothetical protein
VKLPRPGARPRLASRETVEVAHTPGIYGGLATGDQPINLPEGARKGIAGALGRAVRAVIGITVVVGILAGLIYLALAGTVLIVAKPFEMNAVTIRGAFPVGQAPKGAVVLATNGRAAVDVAGKIQEGIVGVNAASVVVVVAGPYAKVHDDPSGQIIADNKPTGYWAPLDARRLAHQYVAICQQGACTPGEAVLIGERAVIGEVKGYIDGFGPLRAPEPIGATQEAPTS